MNDINLTVGLCQEDRNRLDKLIAIGLELADKRLDDLEAAPTEEIVEPEVPAVNDGKLGDKGNEKLFAAVQQKVVKLSAAGKAYKAAVREIVQKFATKVSDIPAEEYDNVMEQLTALEG